VEGRLKCRFFATEKERERFIEEFQEQLSQNGTSLLLGFDPLSTRIFFDPGGSIFCAHKWIN